MVNSRIIRRSNDLKHSRQQFPFISVVVTRSQREDLFTENLNAIHNQGLGLEEYEVLHCERMDSSYPSAQIQRNSGFNSAQGNLVIFLDEDCELESGGLLKIRKLHQMFPELCAIGGSYLNHRKTTLSGRIYNQVCRLWQLSAYPEIPHLLGGALSLKRVAELPSPLFSKEFPFSGEEIALVRTLKEKNLSAMFAPDWGVFHKAQHRPIDLFNRAHQHARAKNQLKALKDFSEPRSKLSSIQLAQKILFQTEPKQLLLLPFALGYILLTNLIAVFYLCLGRVLEGRPSKPKATDSV